MTVPVKVNRLRTTALTRQLTEDYYEEVARAHDNGHWVAWGVGPIPLELCKAMDIHAVHMQNFGARLAAKKGDAQFKKVSEGLGFCPDMCSYTRLTVGCGVLGDMLDSAKAERPDFVRYMPKPDMILCATPCPTMPNWADLLSRMWHVPYFPIETPCTYEAADIPRNMEYVRRQIWDLVAFMEETTGRKLDMDRLKEIMRWLKKGSELRSEVMEMTKNVPAPMSFFDSLITMGPFNIIRGTPQCVDYFQKLHAEVSDRVARGVGSLSDERFRLYWDHLGIWFKVGALSEKFASYGAVVVVGPYTARTFYPFPDQIDPEKPIDTIVNALYFSPPAVSTFESRVERTEQILRDYKIDGMILHSIRTCRPQDIGQYDLIDEMQKRLGVPGVMIHADHVDTDFYDEADVNNTLDSFFEVLEQKKAAKQSIVS